MNATMHRRCTDANADPKASTNTDTYGLSRRYDYAIPKAAYSGAEQQRKKRKWFLLDVDIKHHYYDWFVFLSFGIFWKYCGGQAFCDTMCTNLANNLCPVKAQDAGREQDAELATRQCDKVLE